MDTSPFKKRKLAGVIQQLLRRPLFRASLGLGGLLPMAAALANPSGGQVVGGTATITAPDPDHTVIDQQSQQAIINWQQFSIGSQQYVQFHQPNSTAVVLNRVVGGDPTNILGSLKANGQVFLVNPNGVFFGAGASLDVQGLMATTQNISNSDFMAGHYVFTKGANAPDGSVTNAGTITAKSGGYVVLAGDYAANTGVITAQAGQVVLASGTKTTLTLSGNSLVDFAVNRATLSSLAGVSNAGKITADGGLVVMTADVANQLKATVVNNTGLVEAHSITSHNGTVVLSATGGNIDNSGTLDASATQVGVAGGQVVIRGDEQTALRDTSKVIATGDNAKGGQVEVSGHSLKLRGVVKVGSRGTVIIDPTKLSITTGSTAPSSTGATTYQVGVGYIENQLNSNTNVVLVASNSIAHAGSVTSLSATGTGNLTLKTGTLTTAATGASLGPSGFQCWADGVCTTATGGAGATFTPGNGTISLSGMSINIKGAFNANAGTGTVTTGSVTANAGVTVQGGTVNVGNITAAAGNVTVNAGTGKATLQSVKAARGYIHVNGHGVVATGTLSAGASGAGGSISIAAGTGAASLNKETALTNVTIKGTGVTGTGLLSANAVTVSAGTGNISLVSKTGSLTLNSGANVNVNDTAETGAATLAFGGGTFGAVTAKFGGSAKLTTGLSATSLVLSAAGSLNQGSGAVTLTSGVTLTGAGVSGTGLLSANAVTVSAGTGTISLVSKTGSLTLNSGAKVTFDNKAETGTTTLKFGSGTFGDITGHLGGNVSLASGVSATSLNLDTPGNVVGGAYLYKLGSAWIKAGGSIDFTNAQLSLGSSVNPNASGDTTVTNLLAAYSLAPSSRVPNSVLTAGAGQSITFGKLDFTGSYLQLNADALTFNGTVTVPTSSVVQMAPVSTTSAVSVEQTLATSAPVNFGVTSQLSLFPTVVIGSGKESGNVTLGQNGPLSLKATNLFIVTKGSVSGLSTVQTSGVVADLTTLLQAGSAFHPPTAQEIGGSDDNTTGAHYAQHKPTTGQAAQQIYASPFDAPCLTVVGGGQGYTCAPSTSGHTSG